MTEREQRAAAKRFVETWIVLLSVLLWCGGSDADAADSLPKLPQRAQYKLIQRIYLSGKYPDWNGRDYTCRVYRKNGGYYLESFIIETSCTLGHSFKKFLGKKIVPSPGGLYLKNGRMHLDYRDDGGHPCSASVPFGDFYGDLHASQMPVSRRDAVLGKTGNLQYSEKYGRSGIQKEDDAVVEAFLPTLQRHLRNNDAESISKMIRYPIVADGCDRWLENCEDFLKYYPRIFNGECKRKVLELQEKDIFCNDKGLMIMGYMWFFVEVDGKVYFRVLL